MIKFAAFSLTESVGGLSSDGLVFGEYDYTIMIQTESIADTLNECRIWIEKQLLDYKIRKVKDGRFVIMPVFFNENDPIFDYKND